MFKKVGKFVAAWVAILAFAYLIVAQPQVALVVVSACFLVVACYWVWDLVNY